MEPSVEKYGEYNKIIDGINEKLSIIKMDTSMHASHEYKLLHPCFIELTAMGKKIIPYIIHKITHEGSSWTLMLLLQKISGENPIPNKERSSFLRSIVYWLTWYINSPYINNDDIYHGLITE